MDANNFDELIPIAFAACVSALIGLALWIQYRLRRARLDVLKEALTHREDMDLQALKTLMTGVSEEFSDLRRGAIWLAVAFGGLLFALVLPPEARRVIIGLTAFPTMIGFTLLGFHIFRLRKPLK